MDAPLLPTVWTDIDEVSEDTVVSWIRAWWEATTDKQFRQATMQRPVVHGLCVPGALMMIRSGAHLYGGAFAFLWAVSICYTLLPASVVRRNMAAETGVACAAMGFVFMSGVLSMQGSPEVGTAPLVVVFRCAAFLALFGFHSVVIAGVWLLTAVILLVAGQHGQPFVAASQVPEALFIMFLAFSAEYQFGAFFAESVQIRMATHALIERNADGLCCVHPVSGLISKANEFIAQLFTHRRSKELVPFFDIFDAADRSCFRHVLRQASELNVYEPVVLKFQAALPMRAPSDDGIATPSAKSSLSARMVIAAACDGTGSSGDSETKRTQRVRFAPHVVEPDAFFARVIPFGVSDTGEVCMCVQFLAPAVPPRLVENGKVAEPPSKDTPGFAPWFMFIERSLAERQAREFADAETKTLKKLSGRRRPPSGKNRNTSKRSLGPQSTPSAPRSRNDDSKSIDAIKMALEKFEPTRQFETHMSVLFAMKHWNLLPMADQQLCCTFHAYAMYVRKVAKLLMREGCSDEWRPFTDWQCRECSCMNHRAASKCEICGDSDEASRQHAATPGRGLVPDPPVSDRGPAPLASTPSPLPPRAGEASGQPTPAAQSALAARAWAPPTSAYAAAPT